MIGRSGARVLFVAEDFLGVDRLGALRRALVLAWGTSAEHRARVLREL